MDKFIILSSNDNVHVIFQNAKVTELTVKHGATPVKHGHLKLGQALL